MSLTFTSEYTSLYQELIFLFLYLYLSAVLGALSFTVFNFGRYYHSESSDDAYDDAHLLIKLPIIPSPS